MSDKPYLETCEEGHEPISFMTTNGSCPLCKAIESREEAEAAAKEAEGDRRQGEGALLLREHIDEIKWRFEQIEHLLKRIS